MTPPQIVAAGGGVGLTRLAVAVTGRSGRSSETRLDAKAYRIEIDLPLWVVSNRVMDYLQSPWPSWNLELCGSLRLPDS
jgi:hypothetical protein